MTRAGELILAIRAAGPAFETAAERAEEERALPLEVAHRLRELGLFWLKAPIEVGGSELDPLDFCDVIEELAYYDASAGWAALIGSGNTGAISGWLPSAGLREIFRPDEPLPVIAGQYGPRGTALPVDGGFRVTGRWGFSSGITYADWVAGGCLVEGTKEWIVACVPKSEATVHDVWFVAGLQGTGSNDFSLQDVYVPEAHTIRWPVATPNNPAGRMVEQGRPGLLYRQPPAIFLSNELGPFAIGISLRALDDMIALADKTARQVGGTPISERAAFQKALGHAEAVVHAARLLYRDAVEECWQRTVSGEDLDAVISAEVRARHALVLELCLSAIGDVFRYGGGRVLALGNSMQRHYRNLIAANQHVFISEEYFETSGIAQLRRGVIGHAHES